MSACVCVCEWVWVSERYFWKQQGITSNSALPPLYLPSSSRKENKEARCVILKSNQQHLFTFFGVPTKENALSQRHTEISCHSCKTMTQQPMNLKLFLTSTQIKVTYHAILLNTCCMKNGETLKHFRINNDTITSVLTPPLIQLNSVTP